MQMKLNLLKDLKILIQISCHYLINERSNNTDDKR